MQAVLLAQAGEHGHSCQLAQGCGPNLPGRTSRQREKSPGRTDLLGVRASAIIELPRIEARVKYAARTDGAESSMATMQDRLCAYLELDGYQRDQGIE